MNVKGDYYKECYFTSWCHLREGEEEWREGGIKLDNIRNESNQSPIICVGRQVQIFDTL